MRIADLLIPDRVAIGNQTRSKKRTLEKLSALLVNGRSNPGATEVFDSLLARERLGGTGLGHGIAIPHGRLKSVQRPLAAFLQLQQGIDFDAIDGEPVDLLFALLVPEHCTDEHLELLAHLAGIFRDPQLRAKLREARTPEAIIQLMDQWQDQT